MVKDLRVGMMVATETEGASFPDVGKVIAINSNIDTPVAVQWFDQERATHRPRWLRFFLPGNMTSSIRFSDILLYDFTLTQN